MGIETTHQHETPLKTRERRTVMPLLLLADPGYPMFVVGSASGARYLGDAIEFWNKGRDAMVNWQGTKLECSTTD